MQYSLVTIAAVLERSLAVLELGLALGQERGHAFVLVLGRKQRMEEVTLERDAVTERHLERAVDRLLGHADARAAEGADRLGGLEGDVEQFGGRNDARDQ